jgi:acyl carrier protein
MIKMNKADFFEKLIETLELEGVKINEEYSLNLSSLQVLSLIAFTDENFNKQIKASELSALKTVGDLIKIIGIDNLT